ncbi:hypothetical protein M404DRAFT_994243 [Pisolithus tinctorius Marx 270]|uniref:Uncharacterized protein n=1 Tax=Pisolithus tinctorius Marx 270 TaxID=870435 RepID=A0A0C3PS84_PISTI|nr:hypothetical protein M404DRAFT_994243 [Pisolithus tinctorius Marx 270]
MTTSSSSACAATSAHPPSWLSRLYPLRQSAPFLRGILAILAYTILLVIFIAPFLFCGSFSPAFRIHTVFTSTLVLL